MVKSWMEVLKKSLKKARIDGINEDVWKFTTKLISIKEITKEEHRGKFTGQCLNNWDSAFIGDCSSFS